MTRARDRSRTFSTSPLDAEPTAVLQMPGDTKIPPLLLAFCWRESSRGLVPHSGGYQRWPSWRRRHAPSSGCGRPIFAPPTKSRKLSSASFRSVPLGSHNIGWWGMVCVVSTETAFFGYLLFSYLPGVDIDQPVACYVAEAGVADDQHVDPRIEQRVRLARDA